MSPEILIVDDEADIRMLISGTLMDEGYQTRAEGDADSALAAIRTRRPSLVLLDIWLEGSRMDGMEILDVLRTEHPNLPVVMISGHGTVEMAVSAIRKGAYDFIEKPFKSDRLLLVAARAIEAARLRRENEELKLRAGASLELVGSSQSITQIGTIIDKVSATSSRVLISGPAGVGKEMTARLIHARSPRSPQPFIIVNCATMHPERMESVLFGVEPETSDGPEGGRVGMFEQAHGGTLLLDEVADMPYETQGKIVRVLQDQRFERVGGVSPVEVDVRVVATTNRNLKAEIAANRFREDLFYRIAVVPIEVPALKERPTDIPERLDYFMDAAASRVGQPARRLAPDALAALQQYEWPGNVRQLCNVVDWLIIMTPPNDHNPVSVEMLPPEIAGTPPVPGSEKRGDVMSLPLREARESFERDYLMAQITRFGGNISRTAEFVGMERSALHRKMKALGVHANERGGARGYDA